MARVRRNHVKEKAKPKKKATPKASKGKEKPPPSPREKRKQKRDETAATRTRTESVNGFARGLGSVLTGQKPSEDTNDTERGEKEKAAVENTDDMGEDTGQNETGKRKTVGPCANRHCSLGGIADSTHTCPGCKRISMFPVAKRQKTFNTCCAPTATRKKMTLILIRILITKRKEIIKWLLDKVVPG